VVCVTLDLDKVCLGGDSNDVETGYWCQWLPPNGLGISCRERAAEHLQNATDLAREAVGYSGVLGRAAGTALSFRHL